VCVGGAGEQAQSPHATDKTTAAVGSRKMGLLSPELKDKICTLAEPIALPQAPVAMSAEEAQEEDAETQQQEEEEAQEEDAEEEEEGPPRALALAHRGACPAPLCTWCPQRCACVFKTKTFDKTIRRPGCVCSASTPAGPAPEN